MNINLIAPYSVNPTRNIFFFTRDNTCTVKSSVAAWQRVGLNQRSCSTPGPVSTGMGDRSRVYHPGLLSLRQEAGHSIEVQTHAGHSIAFNMFFALCDSVTLTFDLLT